MQTRPDPRWHHAATWLEDFAIITWVVDPERVKAQLPEGMTPIERAGGTLLSAVAFRDRDFHFRFSPWPKLSCGQVNYRAYVTFDGKPGVWFFTTALDSRLVTIPRALWKMPWRRVSIDITSSAPGDDQRWRLSCEGGQAGADVSLTPTGEAFGVPEGFVDRADADELLDPEDGWYRRVGAQSTGHYSVWHEPLDLESAAVIGNPKIQVFEDLGLMTDARFHSAGIQRSVFFDVHTPPDRVRSA